MVNSKNEQSNHLLMVIAIAAAIVAFFAVGVLATNYFKSMIVEPEREGNIAHLKKITVDQPNNDPLIEYLQQKDLEFRTNYFARQDMSKKAGYILLGAVIVMLIAIKIGWPRQKILPAKQGDVSTQQVTAAASARRTVTFVAIVLAVLAVVSIFNRRINFKQAAPASPAFATMDQVYKNWPSFRGPAGDGISAFTNIPEKFDVKSGDNVLWMSPVPADGNSSPIVWGDRVFLTGGDKNKREVLCYDLNSGKLLWNKPVEILGVKGAAEKIEIMEDTGYAACSPVTDGKHVYAIFATGEIGAFDFEGNKVWAQSLGTPESAYGYASSLAIYQDIVIVQYDQGYEGEKSKLIGIKGGTGKIAWETKRQIPNSWTSPIIAKIGDSYQVITVGVPFVIAYDPLDGTEIWRVEAASGDVAPSPIVKDGIVYVVAPDMELLAIEPVAKGTQAQAKIIWNLEEGAGDIVSPACDGKRVYLVSGNNLTCISVDTKKVLWEKDVDQMVSASPGIVGDKVYLLTEKGRMIVMQSGDEYKEIAVSQLEEKCFASPAFVDGRILIRGVKNLYCIGTRK